MNGRASFPLISRRLVPVVVLLSASSCKPSYSPVEQRCLNQAEALARDFQMAPENLKCKVVHSGGHIKVTVVEKEGQLVGRSFECTFDEQGKFQDMIYYK